MGGISAEKIRAYLLSQTPGASLARELWTSPTGLTYAAYRDHVLARRRQATAAGGGGGATAAGGGGGAATPMAPGPVHWLPATVKYSFEGVRHVIADAPAAVTALSFAAVRSDMLALGCADGALLLVAVPPTGQPACTQARRMHSLAVTAISWSYDNSQLLSIGYDGSLCVWDASDAAALPCIRSISVPTTNFLCGGFHAVNFSLALVGTSHGQTLVYNCTTGMLHSRCTVGGGGVRVTALDSSNHHVFVGDSLGCLHMLSCEMHAGQLSALRAAGRLRLAPPGVQPPPSITELQYIPFCRATDSPILMAALQDGSICIVRANEARHTADLYLRRWVAPATPSTLPATSLPPAAAAAAAQTLLRLRPAVCPLSIIDTPLLAYGSYDTVVYVVDCTVTGGRGGVGGVGGRGDAGPGPGATMERPMTVTALRAHRAPVVSVAWSYDESLLASADTDGILVLWQRCRLF